MKGLKKLMILLAMIFQKLFFEKECFVGSSIIGGSLLQPFLVCRYEAFEKLSQYLGYFPSHVKASLKREPYACFELELEAIERC